MHHSPQRESQLAQETRNEVIHLRTLIYTQDLTLKNFEGEDSAIGPATEIATESSSESTDGLRHSTVERDFPTLGKKDRLEKLKEESRRVLRKARKERARVFNLRLTEAFNAGTEQVKKDSESDERKGCKLVYLSGSGRRNAVRSLGKAYKRGVRTAIARFHFTFAWSSGPSFQQPKD